MTPSRIHAVFKYRRSAERYISVGRVIHRPRCNLFLGGPGRVTRPCLAVATVLGRLRTFLFRPVNGARIVQRPANGDGARRVQRTDVQRSRIGDARPHEALRTQRPQDWTGWMVGNLLFFGAAGQASASSYFIQNPAKCRSGKPLEAHGPRSPHPSLSGKTAGRLGPPQSSSCSPRERIGPTEKSQ